MLRTISNIEVKHQVYIYKSGYFIVMIETILEIIDTFTKMTVLLIVIGVFTLEVMDIDP